MSERPSAIELHRAVKRLRDELALHGMLLAHDVLLPSATRCVAGVSIRGSWWAHPAGTLIYESLKQVESEIARVKLVARKSTLVHRRLWPALAAVARSRAEFQTAGLSVEERALLALVEKTGSLRVDQLPQTGSRKASDVAKQLELRLLVFATNDHTDAGHHTKVLTPFSEWQARAGLDDSQLPELENALELLTLPVRSWVGERTAGLLPWLPALPRGTSRSRRRA